MDREQLANVGRLGRGCKNMCDTGLERYGKRVYLLRQFFAAPWEYGCEEEEERPAIRLRRAGLDSGLKFWRWLDHVL